MLNVDVGQSGQAHGVDNGSRSEALAESREHAALDNREAEQRFERSTHERIAVLAAAFEHFPQEC